METFKSSFPIDFAFNMSIRCSERTAQPGTVFLAWISLLSQYIDISCKNETYIAFTCVNPLLFLLPFIIFIVLLPFSILNSISVLILTP